MGSLTSETLLAIAAAQLVAGRHLHARYDDLAPGRGPQRAQHAQGAGAGRGGHRPGGHDARAMALVAEPNGRNAARAPRVFHGPRRAVLGRRPAAAVGGRAPWRASRRRRSVPGIAAGRGPRAADPAPGARASAAGRRLALVHQPLQFHGRHRRPGGQRGGGDGARLPGAADLCRRGGSLLAPGAGDCCRGRGLSVLELASGPGVHGRLGHRSRWALCWAG